MAQDDQLDESEIELEDDGLLDDLPVQDSPLVTGLYVEGLFGRYNYNLDFPNIATTDRLVMLYGDNGSGKTTILNILWSLLSPAGNRGHRTALEKYPFQSFSVSFSDGSIIEVKKHREITGPYAITVTHAGGNVEIDSPRVL